jgi:hypothetical protein
MINIKDMEVMKSILWRGFVFPGHEACCLFSLDSGWRLDGAAAFSHEQQPCQLNYQIVCDPAWRTLSAQVKGWLGRAIVDVKIKTDASGRWWLNEDEQPQVLDCMDIDLNFSPSTNLLPIRRLDLAIGQTADVKAAWLRFPSFQLELLPQQYRRLDETTYRYESNGGRFVTELKVNRAGFVVHYPGIWQAEVSSES